MINNNKQRIISQIIKCKTHPNYYTIYICCSSKCNQDILLCEKCHSNHANHSIAVYNIDDMVNKVRPSIANVNKGMEITKENHQYADKLINGIGKLLKDEENQVIKKLILEVENQKKDIYQSKKALHKNKQKLLKEFNIMNYFQQLKNKGLLQVKIKTLSKKGIQKFKEKMAKLEQLKKNKRNLKEQLQNLQKQNERLQILIGNSLTQKIQEVLTLELSRRSSLKKTQKTNHTQTSQKSGRTRRINSQKRL